MNCPICDIYMDRVEIKGYFYFICPECLYRERRIISNAVIKQPKLNYTSSIKTGIKKGEINYGT